MILRKNGRTKRAAFTLMEIIVVVAIILILAGSGVFVFTSVLVDANIGRAKMDIKNIEKAITVYKVKHYTYPADLETLTNPDENEAALLKDEALYDPWKQHYIYNPGDLHPKTKVPRIYSNGPPDAPRMISNWDPG